jgi:hypothetical protein
MHLSINSYPSLRDRPRDERQAVLRAALKTHGRAVGWRLLSAFAAIAAGMIAAFDKGSHRVRVLDWRSLCVVAAAAVVLYAYVLWEINGPVHVAVKKYVAAPQGAAGGKRR